MASEAASLMAFYESVWLDANRYYEAERMYYEVLQAEQGKRANPGESPPIVTSSAMSESTLAREIANARQKLQNFLKSGDLGIGSGACTFLERLEKLEKEHDEMLKTIVKLSSDMSGVLSKLSTVDNSMKKFNQITDETQVTKKDDSKIKIENRSSVATDDDDIDLFGSDEEDSIAVTKLREERLQAYANKKSKKPALVAKSSVILDVKPWDDETDLNEMEKAVRAIQTDGLTWSGSKLVPLAYGIKKLQILAVVEDEKVSVDWLQETIAEIEDLVQSVDIAAFNKL